jgi:hypothetical protein
MEVMRLMRLKQDCTEFGTRKTLNPCYDWCLIMRQDETHETERYTEYRRSMRTYQCCVARSIGSHATTTRRGRSLRAGAPKAFVSLRSSSFVGFFSSLSFLRQEPLEAFQASSEDRYEREPPRRHIQGDLPPEN